jgi:hypothetical protein
VIRGRWWADISLNDYVCSAEGTSQQQETVALVRYIDDPNLRPVSEPWNLKMWFEGNLESEYSGAPL